MNEMPKMIENSAPERQDHYHRARHQPDPAAGQSPVSVSSEKDKVSLHV
jgi:hypothetical protein